MNVMTALPTSGLLLLMHFLFVLENRLLGWDIARVALLKLAGMLNYPKIRCFWRCPQYFFSHCFALPKRFTTFARQKPSWYGPVAQLNRASDSGSECRGVESHRGHQSIYRQVVIVAAWRSFVIGVLTEAERAKCKCLRCHECMKGVR